MMFTTRRRPTTRRNFARRMASNAFPAPVYDTGEATTTTTTSTNTADTDYCPAGVNATTEFLAGVTISENITQCAAFSPYALSGSPRSKSPPLGSCPCSPEVPLGSVENEEIKIVTGKTWRRGQDERDQMMIQNLEKNPTTICVDSGAGESVCPVDFFPDYEMHQTEKVGNLYRVAGGQELRNVEKRLKFKTNGIATAMTFQATSHVRKPLAAASKITAKGNWIVLGDENFLSYIENRATGTKIPLKIENGVYVMEVAVSPNTTPFQRQAR